MINIDKIFEQSDYSFNRSLSSPVKLPYTENDILIGVNELANGVNYNTSVLKLQSNLIYLYSVSKYSNPDLPVNYKGWLGTKQTGGTNLNVKIKNIQLYNVIKRDNQGNVIPSTIPYIYITNHLNETFIFQFVRDGISNPDTILLPTGIVEVLDINSLGYEDKGLSDLVSEKLNEYGFVSQSTTIGNETTLTIQSNYNNAIFQGNNNVETIASLFGDNVSIEITQGSKETEFDLHKNSINNLELPNSSNFDNLNGVVLGDAVSPNYQSVFCYSDTRIQVLSGRPKDTNPKFKFVGFTDTYGLNNKLNFLSLSGAAYSDNYLYVADKARNNVTKLNVSGFTTTDNHRNNNFYNTKIIGGPGGVRDNYNFKRPSIIQIYKNNLYVFDEGNSCIKVYNKDLGFIRNIRKNRIIIQNKPTSINIFNDKFYWLTSEGLLIIFDLNLNELKRKKLVFDSNEKFLDIVLSKQTNNFYVLTNRNIYKYFIDSLDYIGKFDFEKININQTNLKFFNIIEKEDRDLIYSYINRNKRGCFIVCDENNDFLNLLSNYNFEIYSNDEITLKKEEYASNFSYNKSILKMISNTLQLRNFIFRKVNVKKVRLNQNQILDVYNGVSYFNPDELYITDFKPDANNFIGVNEIFSRAVVNRVLSLIFTLQEDLLNLMKPSITLPGRGSNLLTNVNLVGLMLETYLAGKTYDFFLQENRVLNDTTTNEAGTPYDDTISQESSV